MTSTVLSDTVRAHKALGHPARIRILTMLRAGELCACQITAVLHLAPSTVSAHLAELRGVGLVVERKDGRWIYYSLAATDTAHEMVAGLWRRIRRDPQIREDSVVVKRLRSVPVEELCRASLDIAKLTVDPGRS
ncbi:MAG: winged helix-turn-helix transcriptional regulator [Gemmatimonadota bacterium]|nr:MAG: winged helix-turn-helix transcriptional regulator [Gemmatimonadota bacterium]